MDFWDYTNDAVQRDGAAPPAPLAAASGLAVIVVYRSTPPIIKGHFLMNK